MSHAAEQKRIAKNTAFLYVRMFVVMAVSLYTSRVVLDKLGVDDYGIYNIAGSVVLSLAFVRNALSSATQRFLSYAKGKGENCSSVFSMSLNIQVVILVICLVLLETIGLYLFANVLKISPERHDAAVIVYHLSVATLCINLLRVPYDALIVSNERMSAYAVMSIVEVFLKLAIVYALVTAAFDKLILYAILMFGVAVVMNLYVAIYNKIKIPEDCHYKFRWDSKQFKEYFAFSFWNLIGGLAGVGSTEGPNYFMNYYLGVRVNAAMGVAKQVSTIIYSFSSSFQNAFNPQIVKSYASGDREYMFSLMFRTSKISLLLMYIIVSPFLFCMTDVLNWWLVEVPDYTMIFCICILLAQLVAAVSSPFWMAAHAVGNIKNYQLGLCGFNLAVIPITWFVLKMGWEPYWVLVSQIFLNFCILIFRVQYLQKKIGFPAGQYYKSIVLKLFVVLPLLTIPFIYLSSRTFGGFWGIMFTVCVSMIVNGLISYFVALSKDERKLVMGFVCNKLHLRVKNEY